MCTDTTRDCGCFNVLDDPLIRLVMESDGVSEYEMVVLMERVRRALLSEGRGIARGERGLGRNDV